MTTPPDLSHPFPRLVPLAGHGSPIARLAFSPDGKTLASGGFDGTVILWDLPTNSMRAHLPKGNWIDDLIFSPDGTTLASVGGDAIALWETTTGKGLPALQGYQMPVAFRSSSELVTLDWSGELVRLDRESGAVLERFSFVRGLPLPDGKAISPDASTLVLSADSNSTLQVWEVETGTLRSTFDDWSDVRCLAISPLNNFLVVGNWSSLRLCDLDTGGRTTLPLSREGGVRSLSISSSGKLLAAATGTGAVKLWALPSGREIGTPSAPDCGASNVVALSPDGKWVAHARHDAAIEIWDVATGECRQRLPGREHEVLCVSFSPEGRTFASGHADGTARWWDAATGKLLRTFYCLGCRVTSLSFSADGHVLASSSIHDFEFARRGMVELWGLGTGVQLQAWEIGHGNIDSVTFLPGRRLMAASLHRGEVDETRVWWRDSGALCYVVEGDAVAVSPDGTLLATATDDEGVNIWDAATGAKVRNLAGLNWVTTMRFSPDGTTLLTGSDVYDLTLWSVVSGERLGSMSTHVETLIALAFFPDGSMAAAGRVYNEELWLYHVQPQAVERNVLSDHEHTTEAVSFHPAGHQFVSASADGTLKVWAIAEGQLLATCLVLPTTDATVSEEWITFTPTGHYVGSEGVDGYVNWLVEDELLPAEAFREEFHQPDRVAEALQPE